MNYFELHIGDYSAATAHLSWDEDLAYRRLISAYYHHERPIPADVKAACRLIRAATTAQRQAVATVLNEFFTLSEDGWRQRRCDDEIERFQDKQRKAKASANARWSHTDRNANAQPNAMRTHTEGNAPMPMPSTQAPDPIPETGADAPASSGAGSTTAGALCRRLKSAGIGNVNPGNLRLLTLLDAGATEGEFLALAPKAKEQGDDPFAYLLGAVEGERKRAVRTAGELHRGPMPVEAEPAWRTEQRERNEAFLGPAAATRRSAPKPTQEIVDVPAIRLG